MLWRKIQLRKVLNCKCDIYSRVDFSDRKPSSRYTHQLFAFALILATCHRTWPILGQAVSQVHNSSIGWKQDQKHSDRQSHKKIRWNFVKKIYSANIPDSQKEENKNRKFGHRSRKQTYMFLNEEHRWACIDEYLSTARIDFETCATRIQIYWMILDYIAWVHWNPLTMLI